MGRKKKTIVIEDAPDERDDESQELEALQDEERILEEEQTREWLIDFQNRFPDQGTRILVEKYDDAGDWATCHKYPLASFDQEMVREEYGAGKYRGTLYNPKGLYIKGGRIQFKFAQAVKRDGPVVLKPENPLENPIVAMMIKSMESNQQTMMTLVTTILQAQAQGSPKGTGLGEMVEVVKALKTMTPTEAKPLDSFKETLTVMKLFKEATGEGSDEKGGLLSDIKDFLEVWPTLKDQLAQVKPNLPTPAGGPPSLTVAQPNPMEPKPMDPLTQKVTEFVPKFIEAGKREAPISEWGRYLLEVFEEEFLPVVTPMLKKQYPVFISDEDDAYEAIVKYAQDPKEKEKIFSAIPPLVPIKPWALQVIDEAVRLALLDPEEVPEGTTSGGGSAILSSVGVATKDNPMNGAEHK